VRKIGSFVVLFALWLLLSGIYKPLIVGFGAVSVLVVLLVTHKMDEIDRDQVDIPLNPVRFVSYLFWLLVEIAKANWIVTKTILSPKMPLPAFVFGSDDAANRSGAGYFCEFNNPDAGNDQC
jgi:multicomponent Na+:H+ antiporter subunit E